MFFIFIKDFIVYLATFYCDKWTEFEQSLIVTTPFIYPTPFNCDRAAYNQIITTLSGSFSSKRVCHGKNRISTVLPLKGFAYEAYTFYLNIKRINLE